MFILYLYKNNVLNLLKIILGYALDFGYMIHISHIGKFTRPDLSLRGSPPFNLSGGQYSCWRISATRLVSFLYDLKFVLAWLRKYQHGLLYINRLKIPTFYDSERASSSARFMTVIIVLYLVDSKVHIFLI